MMFRSGKIILALCAMMLAATGCETMKAADIRMESDRAEIEVMAQRAQEPMPSRRADTIRVDDGIWLGTSTIVSAHGDELPTDFNRVTLVTAEPLTIEEYASRITEITGYPVVIEETPDSNAAAPVAPPADSGDDATAPPVNPLDVAQASLLGVPLNVPEPEVEEPLPVDSGETALNFNFSGRLTDLMNRAATGYGVSWKFSEEHQEIRIFVNETRVFSILAMPGEASFAGDFQSEASQDSGDEGGSTLTASQEASTEADFDFWEEIEESITDLLPDNGTSVTMAPGTGTVTVTAPPYALRRVEEYIADLNERLGRQITVTVTVLTLDISDVDLYDMELNELSFPVGDFTFDLSNAVSVASETDSPGALTFGGVINDDISISAVVNAMSTSGRLTDRQDASVTTMNGRPAPIQVVQQRGYIRERSVLVVDQGPDEVEVTTGQITTGLTVNVLPRILADGEVMLSYNLSVSRLLELADVDTGDGDIQLPTTSINTFMQQVMLQSGSTLVLAGVDQATATRADRGLGTPRFHLLGGGKRGAIERTVTLIMLTPRVLQPWSARRVTDA